MCLERIDEANDSPTDETVFEGYKVFVERSCGAIDFPFYKYDFKLGEWLVAETRRVFQLFKPWYGPTVDPGKFYQYIAGFHLFESLADAKHYAEKLPLSMLYIRTVICKVRYRKVLAKGIQCLDGSYQIKFRPPRPERLELRVTVAKEMMIVEEVQKGALDALPV